MTGGTRTTVALVIGQAITPRVDSYPRQALATAWADAPTRGQGDALIILGATDGRAPRGFAPIAIGLGLTLIHLVGIPVTNLSVNPARSTGPALFVGGWAVQQLWLFWVAPIAGALIAGFLYRWLADER